MKIIKLLYLILITILLIPNLVYADNTTQKPNQGRCVVINGNVFMGGEYIELGIAPRGSFGALTTAPDTFHVVGDNDSIGLSVNARGFNTTKSSTTGDFFLPGTPEERFMIGYVKGEEKDGELNEIVIAQKNGIANFPAPIQDFQTECDCNFSTGLLKATTTGISKDNLKIIIVNEFYNDDKYFKTTVKLENLSNEILTQVRYARSFDPDQDYDLYGTYKTLNKVISNPKPPYTSNMYSMVIAKGIKSNDAFFYMSNDTRSRVSIGTGISPSSIYNDNLWIENDPNIASAPTEGAITTNEGYTESDGYIAITFNLDKLNPKETTTFEYYSSLYPSALEGLNAIETMQFTHGEIKTKNYPKSNNKEDELIIEGVSPKDTIEIYSDPYGRNKILSFEAKEEYYKKDKLVYKLDKEFLEDEGGVIYLSIINESTNEKSNLITYNYESATDTTLSLIWKRLGYTIIILAIITLIYYIYTKYKKRSN